MVFLIVFGFFFWNEFLINEFFCEFCLNFIGMESLCMVLGLGKLFVFMFVVFLEFGYNDVKFFYDLFSERLEFVLVFLCFLIFVLCFGEFLGGLMDCFWKLRLFLLLKFFGGGLFCKNCVWFNNEEFVFCFEILWIVIGFCDLGCLVIFIGCWMLMIIFWIFVWFFFLWRIRFFLVWWRRWLSFFVCFVMFFILILMELRICSDGNKKFR